MRKETGGNIWVNYTINFVLYMSAIEVFLHDIVCVSVSSVFGEISELFRFVEDIGEGGSAFSAPQIVEYAGSETEHQLQHQEEPMGGGVEEEVHHEVHVAVEGEPMRDERERHHIGEQAECRRRVIRPVPVLGLHHHFGADCHDVAGKHLRAKHKDASIACCIITVDRSRLPYIEVIGIDHDGEPIPAGTLPARGPHPGGKHAEIEKRVDFEMEISGGMVECALLRDILLECTHTEREQRREKQVERRHEIRVKARLRSVQRVKAVIAHREHERHVFVQRDERNLRSAQKRISAVNEEQALNMAKAVNDKIGGQRSLSALFAHNAHSDIGRLDHRHIVGSVANGQCNHAIHVLLHQTHHLRLLDRRHPATDHRSTFLQDLQNLTLEFLLFLLLRLSRRDFTAFCVVFSMRENVR
mmetsp:Transcript_63036/g.100161  ORF Transcript_63036/g.100161 Transcript_63036/m.100161 type:complete len:414 (+) Transcript_63036:132-1373(+)